MGASRGNTSAIIVLNGDLTTDFEIQHSSEPVLRIEHDELPNRENITANEIRDTSFTARLTHVQYGTFAAEPAVLLRLTFEFGFSNNSRTKRIHAANIRLILEETLDATLVDPSLRRWRNDPKMRLIAPSQVCGEVTSDVHKPHWDLKVDAGFQKFADVNAGANFGKEREYTQTHRFWLWGKRTGQHPDHPHSNAALWRMEENKVQKYGIRHTFPAAIVATLPSSPANPVTVTGLISPSIVFSVNPCRLRQKRDDPIYLDRQTAKGNPDGARC